VFVGVVRFLSWVVPLTPNRLKLFRVDGAAEKDSEVCLCRRIGVT
jgi:hypothetical protein